MEEISAFAMSVLYIAAGIMHFRNPRFFMKITPPWVPLPKIVNLLVGIVEIVLGLALLFQPLRSIAAVGVIILLLLVFPANIYHHILVRKKGRNQWPTLIRLPIQLVLIYWAYTMI